jgi:hypothetical protein
MTFVPHSTSSFRERIACTGYIYKTEIRDDDVAAHNVMLENCALLGYYALSRGNSLPMFLDP